MLEAFWLSLFMIFIAELGDKTQLVALCMACRYNAKTVLWGVFCATMVVHLFSVALGGLVQRFVHNENWITLAAGIAFVVFGMWTLRGDSLEDEESCGASARRSPFWAVAITFFLAELGDKTMLSTVTLAARDAWFPVWIGSSLGMVVSDGLAIVVGQMMGKKLPERAVKIGAGLIFFAFGVYYAWDGGRHLPGIAVLAGILIVAVLALLLFGLPKFTRTERTICKEES